MFFTQRDADWLSECGGEVGDWCDAGLVGPSAWVDDSWWLGFFKLAGLSHSYMYIHTYYYFFFLSFILFYFIFLYFSFLSWPSNQAT